MHLVLMLQGNRIQSVRAFENFSDAQYAADDAVMDLFCISHFGCWTHGYGRNVYERNGKAVIVEPCNMPGQRE